MILISLNIIFSYNKEQNFKQEFSDKFSDYRIYPHL